MIPSSFRGENKAWDVGQALRLLLKRLLGVTHISIILFTHYLFTHSIDSPEQRMERATVSWPAVGCNPLTGTHWP